MGIMDRVKDIVSANVNAMMPDTRSSYGAEDPVVMVDRYIRTLEMDLQKIRAKELVLEQEQKNAKRHLDECNQEIEKLTRYQERAKAAGNEEDAKVFEHALEKTRAQIEKLTARVAMAEENTVKIHEMYVSLKEQVADLKVKSEDMRTKAREARAYEMAKESALYGANQSIQKTTEDIEKFERLENDINSRLEIAKSQCDDTDYQVRMLVQKYDKEDKAIALEKELESIKKDY